MTDIDALDDPKALQQLSSQLSHVNAGVKIAALRRSVAFQDKAPLKLILEALLDGREYVHSAAIETIEALKPWVTDEQWLEALQKPSDLVYQSALAIMETQGKDAPFKPIFRASFALKRSLRTQAQRLLARQAQQWSPQKVARFIHVHTEILQKATPSGRMIALELLGVLGDRAPVEVFLAALQDSDADVRWAALVQLTAYGKQGHELPIEPIAALINDPSAHVRRSALYALETQEKASVDLFITALYDTDESVKQKAALLLCKRRNIQAIPALLHFLLNDVTRFRWDFQHSVMEAFEDLRAHIPIEPLIDALKNDKEAVRLRAITLLAFLKERTPVKLLIELLEYEDAAMRREAVYELGLGSHWEHFPIETIINKLRDADEEVRRTARYVLLAHHAKISSELLFPLLDSTEGIALVAVIEQLNIRIPMEWLIAAAHNQDAEVRATAIKVLGELGEQVPLNVFLDALDDQEREVQEAVLSAMHYQSHRLPLETLLQALQDPRDRVRLMGIQTIQSLEHMKTELVETVLSLLQDKNYHVRLAAIQTLTQWGITDPVEPFITALADSAFIVREAAFDILVNLGERLPRELLKAQLGDSHAYPFAIKCLQQTHPEVLREVMEEASNILLGQGAGKLLGSIQQAYMAEVIGNMPTPGPLLVNKLVELLDWAHPKVRMTAAQALSKFHISSSKE